MRGRGLDGVSFHGLQMLERQFSMCFRLDGSFNSVKFSVPAPWLKFKAAETGCWVPKLRLQAIKSCGAVLLCTAHVHSHVLPGCSTSEFRAQWLASNMCWWMRGSKLPKKRLSPAEQTLVNRLLRVSFHLRTLRALAVKLRILNSKQAPGPTSAKRARQGAPQREAAAISEMPSAPRFAPARRGPTCIRNPAGGFYRRQNDHPHPTKVLGQGTWKNTKEQVPHTFQRCDAVAFGPIAALGERHQHGTWLSELHPWPMASEVGRGPPLSSG